MYKAKFKSKYTEKYPVRGTHPVNLFYEYRGYEYMVTDMHNGVDDLASQHKTEQARIDAMIDSQLKPSIHVEPAEIGLNLFFESLEA